MEATFARILGGEISLTRVQLTGPEGFSSEKACACRELRTPGCAKGTNVNPDKDCAGVSRDLDEDSILRDLPTQTQPAAAWDGQSLWKSATRMPTMTMLEIYISPKDPSSLYDQTAIIPKEHYSTTDY